MTTNVFYFWFLWSTFHVFNKADFEKTANMFSQNSYFFTFIVSVIINPWIYGWKFLYQCCHIIARLTDKDHFENQFHSKGSKHNFLSQYKTFLYYGRYESI